MMTVTIRPHRIEVDAPTNPYDDWVRRFMETVEGFDAVLVSGYVAIVLGRSRQTEDIDLLVDVDEEAFRRWWKKVHSQGYWCLNADSADSGWEHMQEHLALRFAEEGTTVPNLEFKPAWDTMAKKTLSDAWALDLLGVQCKVSDPNQQIAFKLWLHAGAAGEGPGKDFEDAVHIGLALGGLLDLKEIRAMANTLEVQSDIIHAFEMEVQG